MWRAAVLVLLLVYTSSAQERRITIEQVLSSAFPTEMEPAPSGGMVAWISDSQGVRNLMVAGPPGYLAHKLTNYTADDGQELSSPRWTPDGRQILYVRGLGTNRAGESPNPAQDPQGAEQTIWLVALDGSAPRTIGAGDSPAVSPRGGRVAYISGGELMVADLEGSASPSTPFLTRGRSQNPTWSPDGSRIAFVSDRGDHSFIGVFDFRSRTLQYLDPGVDYDSDPVWSPDSASVAFIRQPSHGEQRIFGARREDHPWSIRLAAAGSGKGRELWRASPGPGSVFHEVRAPRQLLWTAGNRLIFPWEADGWTHLYSLPAAGGKPALVTPGDFEVEYVAPGPGGREIIFNSNQGDVDRRHIWKVSPEGGPPVELTPGDGLEWNPVLTSDSLPAFLRSDARRPARPAILLPAGVRDLDPDALPADFPVAAMTFPEPVTFPSTDGLTIHGQLFQPAARAGRKPAVIFLHGGPRRQMMLGWHSMSYYHNAYGMNQYLASRGFVVLAINFRSGIGYGLNFREALNSGGTGASDFNDVLAAAAYLRSRPDVDPARIGVWGGSYGGYLTAMALARASDQFKVGVDFHGVHDWSTEWEIPPYDPAAKLAFQSSPLNFLQSWRSPVLLIAGDDDRNVHFDQTVALASALRKKGVPLRELVFPDEIHEFLLHRNWVTAYEATAEFLQEHLK
jgi:dipeptidyl aminopeptidase/acylaminoacyl peptidase